MTTRSSHRASAVHDSESPAAEATAIAASAQNGGFETSRQQLAAGAEMMAQWLATCHAIGGVNQHMFERAALMQRQAAESLRAATTQGELLTAQASLFSTTLQDAMRYWQEVMIAALRAVPAQPASERGASAAPSATSPATAAGEVAAAAVQAAAPVMKAWQSMFTAPLNGASFAPH